MVNIWLMMVSEWVSQHGESAKNGWFITENQAKIWIITRGTRILVPSGKLT